ncbi:MAG: glycyl-radical enzyme activating protein [Smithellaceae bacterium]|nr:glycyl-radical enzyme activating protein [Smithellaceae bacterium]
MAETEYRNEHAIVLNIQRMSTEDGPGIRTTVFFKGCPLACLWCHNPESISLKPQIQWIETKCIGCKSCIASCPRKALKDTGEAIVIARESCDGCGICTEACPATAMELLGKNWELATLLREVEKDRAYFENSGGGITVSGGDPTVQTEFVASFLRGCKERGLHTALDTCGLCSRSSLEKLLPFADLVLYDIKEIDPDAHRQFTGHGNERILENLLYVAERMRAHGQPKELWIRTPIIPGATATEGNLLGIGNFLSSHLGKLVSRWELCSFNNLCRDKYRRLGRDWLFQERPLLTRAFMESMTAAAKASGVDPDIVHWTGATRVEQAGDTAEEEWPKLKLVKGCK